MGAVKLKSLRLLRIFRPLKTINALPGMRKLIQALINSIPEFANVVLFLVFVFLMFATIGLHQYNGDFYNACRTAELPDQQSKSWPADVSFGRLCSISGQGNFHCPNGLICGNPSMYPDAIYIETEEMDKRIYVNYGITNFDNIWRSLLTVFQFITSDTWYPQLCNFMDVDMPMFGAIYSLLMIIIGQFFLLNLFLAVIVFAFIKSQQVEVADEIKQLQDENTILEQEAKKKKLFKQPAQWQEGHSPDSMRKREIMHAKLRQKTSLMEKGLRHKLSKKGIIRKSYSLEGPNEQQVNQMQELQVAETFLDDEKEDGNNKSNESKRKNTMIPKPKASSKNIREGDVGSFLRGQIKKRKVADLLRNTTKEKETIETNRKIPIKKDSGFSPMLRDIQKQSKVMTPIASKSNSKMKNQNGGGFSDHVDAQKNIETISHLRIILKQNSKNRAYSCENSPESKRPQSNHKEKTPKIVQDNQTEQVIPLFGIFQNRLVRKGTKGSDPGIQQNDEDNLLQCPVEINKEVSEINTHKQSEVINDDIELASPDIERKLSRPANLVGMFLKKRIESEYTNYFKSLINEATENQNSQKATMRELVGIKVGLEFIKQQLDDEERLQEQRKALQKWTKQNKFFKIAHQISESGLFSNFIALCIISNTIILSLDKYPEDPSRVYYVEKLNIMFACIFVVELLIKLSAVGCKQFFKGSMFNTFDCMIVLASIIDILLSNVILSHEEPQESETIDSIQMIANSNYTLHDYLLMFPSEQEVELPIEYKQVTIGVTLASSNSQMNGSLFTVMRILRLLRIFKLARQWKRFELLLETMGKSFKDISNFAVFMFLFIFIFTLLGLELFAFKAKLDPDTTELDLINGQSPAFNFDTFLNSFSLVFIILTNDGQAAVYYNYYRSVGALSATVFFVLLVLVGQKIIINLFVAILLENFDEGELKQKLHDFEQESLGKDSNSRMQYFVFRAKEWYQTQIVQRIKNMIKIEEDLDSEENDDQKKNDKANEMKQLSPEEQEQAMKEIKAKKRALLGLRPIGNSLFIFYKDSSLRQNAFNIAKSKGFELMILFTVIVSSVILALDGPLVDPSSSLNGTISNIDMLTTLMFIFEACIKIVAFGLLFNGRQSYLWSMENKGDFLIILFSILSMTNMSDDFRSFKCFRILRLISKSDGLKVAVRALFRAVPNIANVTLIMILFFLIFAVIFVSQFKGKFYFCTEDLATGVSVESQWDCLNAGGIWDNQVYTFDDMPNALITLFVMSTTAGWQDVLLNSITSTEVGFVSHEYRDPWWSMAFILFLIVGFFFFLNLFIGVVVSTFNSEQDKLGGNDLLTEKQREWIDLKLLILRAAPIRRIKAPKCCLFRICFNIQAHKKFDSFIFLCILTNTFFLCLKWYQQPIEMTTTLEVINYIFTSIFIVEALIKLMGQSPRVYFSEGWNRFDFLIAFGSLASIIISAYSGLSIKGAIGLVRSVRVLRILRLLKKGGRSLYMIFNTFVITFHSLANIGGLLILIIYMYSVLGMYLFGTVKRNGIMNDYINFENFINAFITLFTVTTGDSWNATQTSFVVENSPHRQCKDNPAYEDYILAGETIGCGSKFAAYFYFTSFTFIVSMIFLQLFIAVILQGYDDTQIQESRLFNNEMTQIFRETWAEFDPNATAFIKMNQLRNFLIALGEPLGFDRDCLSRRFFQDKFIAQLELPTYHNFTHYQFLDVLDSLSFRMMVLDHIKKKFMPQDQADIAVNDKSNKDDAGKGKRPTRAEKEKDFFRRLDSNIELEIKDEIQKEVNKLLYQSRSERISAVRNIMSQELKKGRKVISGMDNNGFNSSHQMAAEAAVRKMREFIMKQRSEKTIIKKEDLDYSMNQKYSINTKKEGLATNSSAAGVSVQRQKTSKFEEQKHSKLRLLEDQDSSSSFSESFSSSHQNLQIELLRLASDVSQHDNGVKRRSQVSGAESKPQQFEGTPAFSKGMTTRQQQNKFSHKDSRNHLKLGKSLFNKKDTAHRGDTLNNKGKSYHEQEPAEQQRSLDSFASSSDSISSPEDAGEQ